MDVFGLNRFDIFEIYRRFCDITSGASSCGKEEYRRDDESQKTQYSREALAHLLNLVESLSHPRVLIFDEVLKLMSRLDLMVDYSEFSRFYDFVFFICRENGQKNITVSRAVMAWRLVLAGRFRLLNEWCDFVEKNQRHNISEDTWRQVLAFSRCVHENLGGYDPEGAWPILVDEFVEHMYRIKGSNDTPNLYCSCGDLEAQPCEDPLPGLKIFPGLKRKCDYFIEQDMEVSDNFANSETSKRRQTDSADKFMILVENSLGNTTDDSMEIVKHNNSPFGGSKPQCAVEGCLSKGFAGLFSSRSRMQFDGERRVS